MASHTTSERIWVGKRSQFYNGARQLVRCGERNIAVVCHQDKLYAIDNACYHHGGPLLSGDIEDLGGHPCIVCPWHSYKIALDTGEGLYLGVTIDPKGGRPQEAVRSKGRKQRVHQVEVDEAGDVYVLVDLNGPKWESDTYASMKLANRERPMGQPMEKAGHGPHGLGLHSGVGVELSSGHVFQQMGRTRAGTGATNPFDALNRSRAPISGVVTAHRRGSPADLMVACIRSEEVCSGVRQLDFAHYSGSLQRHAELGEYVELELPIKETRPEALADGALARTRGSSVSSVGSALALTIPATPGEGLMHRRWTICDVNRKGTLFSLVVKSSQMNPQTSGSAWLHHHALHAPLRVVRVGGTFTFADHQETIRRLGGNVLWLTAGMGITAAYAFLNSALDDSFFVEGNEALHVVHLHANHTLETVPMLPQFVRWQRRFARHGSPRATSSPPQPQPPSSSLQSAGEMSRKNSGGTGDQSKTFTMELFITPSKAAGEKQRNVLEAPSDFPTEPRTNRARMEREDIVLALRNYFPVKVPLIYVCGPPEFVRDGTNALLSAGVPESHILTDDP